MNSTAVTRSEDVFLTSLHIFIHDDRTVRQHIHLAFEQLCIRTEADAQNNQIRFKLPFGRDYLSHFAILSSKLLYRLTKSQLDAASNTYLRSHP